MIIANGKGRMSTLAVDDDLDMNGRNVTNADVVSVNEHVTLVGAQRLPGKGFRSNEYNGWNVSKDNGDIERKFWKDDFSVDSSSQYTVTGSITGWGSGEIAFTAGGCSFYRSCVTPVSEFYLKAVLRFDERLTDAIRYLKLSASNLSTGQYVESTRYQSEQIENGVRQFNGVKYTTTHTGISGLITDYATLEFWKIGSTLYTRINGGEIWSDPCEIDTTFTIFRVYAPAAAHVSDLVILTGNPTSYTDDFTSDTVTGANGRYQAVTGTVAYDDVNKRMNVTTATGVNGKASGRLKSYKFTEGSQIYDVTLPTGADGDFITLVTHSANGLMTDGIGVGLQSDGAGKWNLATLSGTTVTEGVDSGLDDADVARIEIEKDLSGAYWYYIYDAAGTKPTTATGKLFTTLTEGYTGWYANGAGAETQTYVIDNISIRAESIVGRTNVQVEEPFWFRDEFGEDSIGRYPHFSVWSISNGNLIRSVGSGLPIWFTNKQISNFDVTFDFKPHLTDNTDPNRKFWFVFGSNKNKVESYEKGIRYLLRLNCRTSSTICYLDKFDVTYQSGLHIFGSTTDIFEGQEGFTSVRILLVNGVLSLYINGVQLGTTYNIGENVVGYIGAYGWGTTDVYEIDNLQISGTRVYNKPIHRGAMLETYHDGTQEVVGTTFVDDCQWDRSAEWTAQNTPTWDTTNGVIGCNAANEGVFSKPSFGDGWYYAKFVTLGADESPCITMMSQEVSSASDAGMRYMVYYYPSSGGWRLVRVNAGKPLIISKYTATLPAGTYRLGVLKSGSIIKVYLNDIQIMDVTDSSPLVTKGFTGFSIRGNITTGLNISDIQIIATSPDATNGIAACIPPIGGGARYGVEESVYNTFTTANVDKGVYLTSAKVKTTNPNADEVSLEYVNETTSTTLDNTSIVVDVDYTIKTTPITIKENETDVLTVGVKNSTTCNQPATYVESLSLIPVSGNNVLYPQDLAFISGVKPSQKRKVEVK